jgi:xanthine dehydrogenase YagR molybdenum-binding subunit
VVQSEVAVGRVTTIDTSLAEEAAGVHAVITHLNAPRLKRVKTLLTTELDCYLPLQDDRIRYNGQPLAVVVAQELVQAQYAASLIAIRYEKAEMPAALSFGHRLRYAEEVKKVGAGDPAIVRRGKPDRAFDRAPLQFEQTYATPPEHHNAIEPGATVAAWDKDGRLIVHNATQFAYGDAVALAQAFGFGVKDGMLRLGSQIAAGLEMRSDVRVIAPLVGGGFGGKGTNAHMVIAAMAAKVAGAPVKLVLTREQTYPMMPYRPAVVQHLKIGATRDGRISAILHDCIVQGAPTSNYIEPSGEMTPHLYQCPNLRMTHKLVKLDVNGPSWMRAPGAASGMFSLECAIDELAEALGLDPVEIRVRNHADVDPQSARLGQASL